VSVSDDLLSILLKARSIYEASAGAFDVTVGPVVRLWRRARRDRKMPSPDLLSRARSLVSFDLVSIDPIAKKVTLRNRGMKLDLGGIAKGFASDAAITVLKANGVERALVAGAGDIVMSQPPPGRDGWVVGIAPLENPNGDPEILLSLHDAAVSTSGDSERYVEIDGRRYAHIVDPRTGLGIVERASVTVVASDGSTSDALATAVYTLGPERGLALVEKTDTASTLIVRAGDGRRERLASQRFKKLSKVKADKAAIPAATVSPR